MARQRKSKATVRSSRGPRVSANRFAAPGWLGGLNLLCCASGLAILAMQAVPAQAEIVAASDGIGANISVDGSVTNIHAGQVTGNVAFNSFDKFNVDGGITVNMYEPNAAQALVNIVRGGQSNIAGTLNLYKGDTGSALGSNVFFVNPDGFLVSAGGIINAGQLTLSTATGAFADSLVDQAGGSGNATDRLFAGTEPLSNTGEIRILGEINASRLEMRAGQRMVVDGRIAVSDPAASGVIVPAVNTSGVAEAGGVSVQGGVIRLFAAGDVQVASSARVSAKRGNSGGTVIVKAEGNVSTDNGAEIDVSGSSGHHAGSVVIFTDGSATLAAGTVVNARSDSGNGGFVLVQADEDISLGGWFDTGSASGQVGEVLISAGETVTVTGNVRTGGGDMAIGGEDRLTVNADVSISTHGVGRGNEVGASGDLFLISPEISVLSGASLTATGGGMEQDGIVALLARDRTDNGVNWAVDVPKASATISVSNAAISGGAVVISAYAQAGHVLGSEDQAVERAQVEDAEAQAESWEASLDDLLGQAEAMFDQLLTGGLSTVNALVPVQVHVVAAEAKITLTDSTVTASGDWKNASLAPVADGTPLQSAAHGLFSALGLVEHGYEFLTDGMAGLNVRLPAGFDAATDSVYVHAHGQTDVTIAPKAYGLGVAVPVTNTKSLVRITGGSITTLAGGVDLYATAQENLAVAVAAKPIAGVAAGVIVSVRDLTNQIVVDGGSITAAGTVNVGAYTGKSHVISNTSNAGKEGKGAIAVTVAIGNSLTEAALGGTVTLTGPASAGAVTVAAETLYFNKSHTASTTMGVANPTTLFIERQFPLVTKIKGYATSLKQKLMGSKEDDEPTKKEGFGFGLTADVQLDQDDTFATLGGSYSDLSGGRVDLGATTVTTAGDVNVTSKMRFAETDEGGIGLARAISASMGKLGLALKAQVAAMNATLPEDKQITEQDLLGQYGHAVFLSGSVSLMAGETRAEVGPATVNARNLNVAALTAYPFRNPISEIRDEWERFTNEVSDYNPAGVITGNPDVMPQAPDITLLLPMSYFTTDTAAKAKAPNPGPGGGEQDTPAEAEDQKLAVGVTVNYFSTDNVTTAVIRDGARVTLPAVAGGDEATGNLTVHAAQEATFIHVANMPKTNPLGAGKINNAIGAAVNIGRSVSTVAAEIESGTVIIADDVDIDAETRIVQANLSYAGGSGKGTTINAGLAASVMEATTRARLGAGANVSASGDITISATDRSVNWGIAGGISGSENIGVGAAGNVNFTTRKVQAGIWDAAIAGNGAMISAASLSVNARNNSLDVASAVAGAKVAGKPVAEPEPEDQTNDDDKIIPDWLFKDAETDALNKQAKVDTPEGSDKTKQQTGWSVAGAAALNLMLGNVTTAEIATRARLEIAGDLAVRAANNGVAVTATGAVAAGLGSTQDNNALAGAFSVHVDQRQVTARISDATIRAGGTLDVLASDGATVVNVAVGGAGTSRGDLALAGSVAVAVLNGGVDARAQDITVEDAGAVTLLARDDSLTVGVGGGVGVNLDKSGGAGVGVGVAVNVIDRGATTTLSGASAITAASLTTRAEAQALIFGFGISAGVGKTGVAGSVSVNTITNGARVVIADDDDRITIRTGALTAEAKEDNAIWSLAGAVAAGGKNAVGGAASVNVIVADTGVTLRNVDISGVPESLDPDAPEARALGAVALRAEASSLVRSLAVAGGAASEQVGIGVGISSNTIDVNATVTMTGGNVVDAASFTASAIGGRSIWSGGGGVAGAGKGAAGFASTINLLIGNDTIVDLDGSSVSTVADGDIAAAALASGEIASVAAAVSLSKDVSIGGAVTVNVSTGRTQVLADDATLTAAGDLTFSAEDKLVISSLAGSAALSSGQAGVGGAIAANIIKHDTSVLAENAALTSGGDLRAAADNDATIRSLAAGISVANAAAVAASIAVGDIGNSTRVALTGGSLSAVGKAELSAQQGSRIDILSGSVAASAGSAAVGAAVTTAMIHDTVTADLVTLGALDAETLSVKADKNSSIDAIAVSGAGSGGTSVAGSLVYTQIGRPGSAAPSVAPLPGGEADDPVGESQDEAVQVRNLSMDALRGASGNDTLTLTLDADDLTRARVELGTGAPLDVTLPSMNIGTVEGSAIRSLAGGVAGGSTAGVGAGIAVNLLFGKTEAELVLPAGLRSGGAVAVTADQTGSIESLAAAGGGGGTVGGAGSILVNVMDRQATARITGNGAGAGIATRGGAVTLRATQTGTISTLAGAAGIGGTAGIGGAIVVNVMSDDVAAELLDVTVDTRADGAPTVSGAGAFSLTATQAREIEALAIAASGGGTGAFAGSFAVNVAEGSSRALLSRADLLVGSADIGAAAANDLMAISGAASAAGKVAVGLGVVTNVSRSTVQADIDGTRLRAGGSVRVTADAATALSGSAVSGAGAGIAAVTGTGVGNSTRNKVEVLVRNTGAETDFGGSDIAALGSVALLASAQNQIALIGGTDGDGVSDGGGPSLNLSITGAGAAGVGASVTVNETRNEVLTLVSGQSRVVGLGHSTVDGGRLGAGLRGVIVDAHADTDVMALTANGAAAGAVGVAGVLSFSILSDSATTRVGGATMADVGSINGALEDEAAEGVGSEVLLTLGRVDAHAQQAARVQAAVGTRAETYALALGIGGSTGVGAAGSTTIVTSEALVDIALGHVGAYGDVTIGADAQTRLESYAAGAGGGFVGVAGSANVNRLGSLARVELTGASIVAGEPTGASAPTGGDLRIFADNSNSSTTFVGGIAGGAVGVAGAIQVNLFESRAEIDIAAADVPADEAYTGQGHLVANRDLSVAANTGIDAESYAASAAGGWVGIGISANVNLIEATTQVQIGAGEALDAGRDLRLSAIEDADITGMAGALGVGAVGAGASFDYARLESVVGVNIGEGAALRATSGDISLAAEATRRMSSDVMVGSVGLGGLSAAISLIELGGDAADPDGEDAGLLAGVQSELDSDQTTGGSAGSKSSVESVAAYAGGADTRTSATASRQGVDVTRAARADGVAVNIGADTLLRSGGDVTLDAQSRAAVAQRGGVAAAGVSAGISSGTVVANVGSSAGIGLGAGTQVQAGGDIAMTAATGGIGGSRVIDAQAATLAASGGFSAGVGVAVARVSGSAAILAGNGVVLGGRDIDRAGTVTLSAERSDLVRARVFNATLGLGGLGMAYADARNTGATAITLGTGTGDKVQVRGASVSIGLSDRTGAEADAVSSTGGIVAGNGVLADARNTGVATLALHGVVVDGGAVSLRNTASGRAAAEARGVAAGALGVGTSVARARADMTVTTQLDGVQITGDTITIRSTLDDALGRNAVARATSSSGALIAGNGAEADARADYSILTEISGDIIAAGPVEIGTILSGYGGNAEATGRSGGLVAIGATIARVGQSDGRTGSAITRFGQGNLFGNAVRIETANAPALSATALSGSGGLVSGSGSEIRVDGRTRTLTELGMAGDLEIVAGTLTIGSSHAARLAARLDTTSAAAVGASGADSRTSFRTDVDTTIGSRTAIEAAHIDISAANGVSRPQSGFNITSGSGGALDVAAMISRVDVWATTDLTVNGSATIRQVGLPEDPGLFRMGVVTDMHLIDRLKLDAGGAIAIPTGSSKVIVRQNDANVTIGSAELFGVGTLTLFAGGDANILSEVDTKSYGLAGAASSLTEATYNAAHNIALLPGAFVETLGNAELLAGYKATGAQTVTVKAESRVYNKTAFPVVTNPDADALANTRSRVTVGEGAQVLAVRDVFVFAEGGSRNVLGYGRGKDLYREVLAAIGSFFSNLVGGGDVSLDIETGTSTDRADNGILVNGYVRAGSRNQQVLILDENNLLANAASGYDPELAKDIEWRVETDVSIANTLQQRINLLNSYINDPVLNRDAAAVAAWTAERGQLQARLAEAGTGRTDVIHLGDILAVEGNIVMRADYVQGEATGLLEAPGDALIRVHAHSGAFLETAKLTIPDAEGGRIILNDVSVRNATEMRQVSGNRAGRYDFGMITGENSDEPLIEIVTYAPAGMTSGGTITVAGDVFNPNGTARIVSNYGDIAVQSDISALTIDIDVPNGDFIQGYKVGVTDVGGEPQSQYKNYFQRVQNQYRNTLIGIPQNWRPGTRIEARTGGSATLSAVPSAGGRINLGTTNLPGFTLAATQSRIRAGKNVYISADVLNINGLIQAGRGSYVVDIDAGVDAEIAALGTGSGLTLLYDPAEPVTPAVVRSANIVSDVRVYYNHDTGQIEVDPMVVQGGRVELVGNVISTGSGRIESLDGYGNIVVNSDAVTAVLLKRIDTGPAGAGVEGVVRITDTARRNSRNEFLITEYRRAGSQMQVYTNESYTKTTDQNGIERVTLTHLQGSSTANDGRLGSYAPVANRDLVILQGETTTYVASMREKQLIVIGIRGSKTKETITETLKTTVDTKYVTGGPYVAPSLGGADYQYALVATLVDKSKTTTPKVKTHDSVKWYKFGSGWRHWDWTETTQTTQLYEHRLKADHAVSIAFSGSDTGGLNVTTRGNVIFADTVTNLVGNTAITSTQGSVLTADTRVILNTGGLNVAALGGRIGGLSGEFRVDTNDGATLSARARDAIDIREMRGDLIVAGMETTARSSQAGTAYSGDISIRADGTIHAASGDVVIRGTNITLQSDNEGIGSAARDLAIDSDGGVLRARARGDIAIAETHGDLGLHTVRSDLGSVRLVAANGSILDRNDIEQRDIRTEAELVDLWANDLGLYGDAALAERRTAAIDAIRAERERAYDLYWSERTRSGGPVEFALPAAEQQSLLDGGWTQEQLDSYVADRAALYTAWNAQSTRDPDYRYQLSAAERASILDGQDWSHDQLTRSIRAGLVRQTGDTTIRVEDPNVTAAGDITLIARDMVGELLPDYAIAARAGNLTAEDLRRIASAERDDIVIDGVTGEIRIRQNEDVNFAFTDIAQDGSAQGALRVTTANRDIYLGARTPASLAEIISGRDVDIKIDGAMTDAATGDVAVHGRIITLESGNHASIGTEDKPLTVRPTDGGHLVARSGQNLHISAPAGDLPLSDIYAGGRATLHSLGTIRDVVGNDVPRIVAGELALNASAIGSADRALGVQLVPANAGRLDLTTRAGDAWLKAHGDLRLASARIHGGGRLEGTDGFALIGADTLSFGQNATLDLILPQGLNLDVASGVDIAGGWLNVLSGGSVGTGERLLNTALARLSFAATGSAATTLMLTEQDDLRVETVTQNANPDSDTRIVAAGALSVGQITSVAEVVLDAAAITEGRIIGHRVDLLAAGDIGATSRVDVTATRFRAETADGSAALLLRDRAVEIEVIAIGSDGALDLRSQDAPVTLLAGQGITTQGGAITAALTSLEAAADIRSAGGNIALTVVGDMAQRAGATLDAGTGRIEALIGGNLVLSRFATSNMTATALDLAVDGTLSLAAGRPGTALEANAAGAGTRLRLGALDPAGPEGLDVALDRLDAQVARGDLHLQERDDLILQDVRSQAGSVDVFAGGAMQVGTVLAGGTDRAITLSAMGDLRADAASLDGQQIRLFAHEGQLTGISGQYFTADMAAGATGYLLAGSDLHYRESIGDLRLGFALSGGDLRVEAPDGRMELGVLGAARDLTLEAAGELSVNVIGAAEVDLADELALRLVRPELYGTRIAQAPATVDLTATGEGSRLYAGHITARDSIWLRADHIDVSAADWTPADGLALGITDSSGSFADEVDVRVVASGRVVQMPDPFADIRALLGDRSRADGVLTLEHGRIGTGQVSHAGPRFVGENVVINGDVRFRQRSFDLFALVDYGALTTFDDAQVLANDGGRIGFTITNEIVLTTNHVLVLNRRLGGLDLNGGQGFAYGVGVETGILSDTFVRGAPAGVTPLLLRERSERIKIKDGKIHLPIVLASVDCVPFPGQTGFQTCKTE